MRNDDYKRETLPDWPQPEKCFLRCFSALVTVLYFALGSSFRNTKPRSRGRSAPGVAIGGQHDAYKSSTRCWASGALLGERRAADTLTSADARWYDGEVRPTRDDLGYRGRSFFIPPDSYR